MSYNENTHNFKWFDFLVIKFINVEYIYIYIFKKNLGHYYVAIVEMDPFYICQKAVCGCLCILEE